MPPAEKPPGTIAGWDVGGAHLKAVVLDSGGEIRYAAQRPCRLWLGIQELDAALDRVIAEAPPCASHAVTMTGELADCFASRAQGVAEITAAMARNLHPAYVRFFSGLKGFVGALDAAQSHGQIASANWLASALFCAQRVDQALLIDIGSTTTDIVVVDGGTVAARGSDDRTRLQYDELVYTGVVRTPLATLASHAPFAGEWHNLATETFATTADVYRLTGELPEYVDQMPAADNGGKTLQDCARRLARVIGAEADAAPLAAWQALARFFAERQLGSIHSACERALSRNLLDSQAPLIAAGTGTFIVGKLAARLGRPCFEFAELLPVAADFRWLAACAPAYSVAMLALADARR